MALNKNPKRSLRLMYPELKTIEDDIRPSDWDYEIQYKPPHDPSTETFGYRVTWRIGSTPSPTEQEIVQWMTDNDALISAQIANEVGSIIDTVFNGLAHEVTGEERIDEMKVQKWRRQEAIAERWRDDGKPAIDGTGPYKLIFSSAQARQQDPTELAEQWLVKAKNWGDLLDGYGLFSDGKKAAIKAMPSDKAEAELDEAKIEAGLRTALGLIK